MLDIAGPRFTPDDVGGGDGGAAHVRGVASARKTGVDLVFFVREFIDFHVQQQMQLHTAINRRFERIGREMTID